jgi:hypothetical protein
VLISGAGDGYRSSVGYHVRNEEVLQRVKEERNIRHAIKQGRLTGLITSCRNCLLKHIIEGNIEGKIEVMGR